MPNHWETSARPLFVKTVFVNGNRHAILSEEDPLLRCGKKISRPNSSLSSASDLSITFSDSQDSSSEGKSSKPKNASQAKDLSSELQDCLIKLKLASGSFEVPNKSSLEKCPCTQNSKEHKRSRSRERGNSKHRRHKSNHEKTSRRERQEEHCDEPKEYKMGSSGRKSSSENSCYVYNLENYKGKKKYCFVKISSQPPQFILNCCCEKNWNETHQYNPSNKNNLVISATIHNLVMTTEGDENLRKTFDYIFPFQNAELHWNKYLTKSYYNSLSDRVFQWLDLARKRKTRPEKMDSTEENDSSNNTTERIFSGKTFVGEKNEFPFREGRLFMNKKIEKVAKNETVDDIEGEVVGEPQVETLLSTEKSNFRGQNSPKRAIPRPRSFSEQKTHNYVRDANSPNTNVSLLKIQDLFLNLDTREEQKRKSRGSSPQQHKPKETGKEESDFLTTAINSWEKRISEENIFQFHKFDTSQRCQLTGNSDEVAVAIKNPIPAEEFAERNQKSINNLNITRTRPVLIQNSLSPQQQTQPGKTCYPDQEKIVWASEKSTGRPQLHIFMPSVLRKDQSEDSMSECEGFMTS